MISQSIYYAPLDVQNNAGNDCDCACAMVASPPAGRNHSPDTMLQRHPDLYELALDQQHVVACVPSYSRVAVLGAPARTWLHQLATPVRLADLNEDERQASLTLLDLGLVVPVDYAPQPPAAPDELVAWLHVTNACNLRCTYCYIEKTDDAMSAETANAAVDAIVRSASAHGYQHILLKYAGGEASLNLARVSQIHQYASQQCQANRMVLRGVVLSNGVSLTSHKLAQIQQLGLRLMISLDGPAASHDAQRPRLGGQGSYAAVTAAILRAQRIGLDLTVSVTVTGTSASGLREVVAWLLEHQIHFTLNFYRECDSSARYDALQLDQQRLIEGMRAAYAVIGQHPPRYSLLGSLLDRTHLGAAHQRTCAVGQNYMVIDHNGGIAKCQMEIQRSVSNVWAPDPLLEVRLDRHGVQNLPVEQKTGCNVCTWRYWCAGGCAVATYRATGRYDIKSPNCGIYTALYPEVLRLEGVRILHWAMQANLPTA